MGIQETYTLTYAEMSALAFAFLNARELLLPKFKNETKAEMQYRMALAKKRIEAAEEKFNRIIYGGKNDGTETI